MRNILPRQIGIRLGACLLCCAGLGGFPQALASQSVQVAPRNAEPWTEQHNTTPSAGLPHDVGHLPAPLHTHADAFRRTIEQTQLRTIYSENMGDEDADEEFEDSPVYHVIAGWVHTYGVGVACGTSPTRPHLDAERTREYYGRAKELRRPPPAQPGGEVRSHPYTPNQNDGRVLHTLLHGFGLAGATSSEQAQTQLPALSLSTPPQNPYLRALLATFLYDGVLPLADGASVAGVTGWLEPMPDDRFAPPAEFMTAPGAALYLEVLSNRLAEESPGEADRTTLRNQYGQYYTHYLDAAAPHGGLVYRLGRAINARTTSTEDVLSNVLNHARQLERDYRPPYTALTSDDPQQLSLDNDIYAHRQALMAEMENVFAPGLNMWDWTMAGAGVSGMTAWTAGDGFWPAFAGLLVTSGGYLSALAPAQVRRVCCKRRRIAYALPSAAHSTDEREERVALLQCIAHYISLRDRAHPNKLNETSTVVGKIKDALQGQYRNVPDHAWVAYDYIEDDWQDDPHAPID